MTSNKKKQQIQKAWTPEEDERLQYLLERHGREKTAKLMGRSLDSIKYRIRYLELDMQTMGELITIKDFSEAMNIPVTSIHKWVKDRGLPTRKIGHYRKLKMADFWQWAQDNTQRINWTKVPYNAIPPEPDWVQPLRTERNGQSLKFWTEEEKYILKQDYYFGVPYKETAQKLGRTEHAVSDQRHAMGLQLNNKASRRERFTQAEDKQMIELYASGKSIKQVAETMGLTYSSAHSRYKILKKRGLLGKDLP